MAKKTVILFYGLFSEDQSYDWIPYGPVFVSAIANAAGFSTVLIHEHRDRDYEHIIREHAKDTLLFGVSAMTGYQIASGMKAVECFRKYAPDGVPVIFGGAHPTALPRNTLESGYADYVCVGSAKNSFVDLLRSLQKGDAGKRDFPGIFGKNSILRPDPTDYKSDYVSDLKAFPPLNLDRYDFSYLLTSNRVLSYTASIGCRGACTFCSWGGGAHPWSAFPVERVLDDIEHLVKKYKLSSIWFSDSELSTDKEYILNLAQGIMDRRLNIWWRCNARAVELAGYKTDDYAMLERSGLDRLFIGIENVNRDIQRAYKKVISTDLMARIAQDTSDFDIQLMLSFIFANPVGPLSDLEENRRHLDAWRAINHNVKFQVCFFTPYPGTSMTELAMNKGYEAPEEFGEYGRSPYFVDTDRFHIDRRIPWYTESESSDYIQRYNKLFPNTDCAADWNWRSSLKENAKI